MQVYKAQVVNTQDLSYQGRITVYCKDISDQPFEVVYVSPVSYGHSGGFVAIPEEGVEVLIVKTSGSDKDWYYMGSIFAPKEGVDETGTVFEDAKKILPDDEIYRARGKPQRITLKDQKGNQIVLSSSYNKDFFNIKAEMKSSLGKRLSLIDSPNLDCIYLKNEHGDGIKITAGPSMSSAARSVEVESEGPQKYICRNSDMDLLVKEGRELNIFNESTGLNKDPLLPLRVGNVNIKSKFNDVNIWAENENGSVFIDAIGSDGLVQIDSGGKITIYSDGNVEVRAGGDMGFKAEGNIFLDADNNVDINAGGSVNISSGGLASMEAGGNVALDGSQVHLNSGQAVSAETINIDKEENNYGK